VRERESKRAKEIKKKKNERESTEVEEDETS